MAFQRHNFGARRQQGRPHFGGQSRGGSRQGRGNKIRYMDVDPRMLIKKAEPREEQVYIATNTFDGFGFNPLLTSNVKAKGYVTPTPIQDKVIPSIMQGSDVIGLAATGTGKTAAFLVPILHSLMAKPQSQAIIITPTRELAVQILEEGRTFARGSSLSHALLIGGVDMNRQIRDLRRHPAIVIGTPGRIKDLSERREINLSAYSTIVLDEVDRMLDMGFLRDMTFIIQKLPTVRQSLFFSATMTPKAREIAQTFLRTPVVVQIETQQASVNVDQDIVKVAGRNKVDVLHDLLIQPGFDKVLVFGRTKHGMEKLSTVLADRGFATAAIHGNKSQNQRQRALNAFKQNQVKVLLATDVAARGIDIDTVTHVINYELPETYADYIHRIGRTGRADKTGVALTFID